LWGVFNQIVDENVLKTFNTLCLNTYKNKKFCMFINNKWEHIGNLVKKIQRTPKVLKITK
jgi:hypothetical protein